MKQQNSDKIVIRPARGEDLPAITGIYAHHVRHGLASFEEEPPALAEMTRRYHALVDKDYPYLVAEASGEILGYAYAGPYRPRPAYRYSVENSVYVAPTAARRGAGGLLLDALISACQARGFRQMIAVIGDSGNEGSIGLHASRGFRHAGHLTGTGFKLGRWVDTVFMQLALGPGDTCPPG